MNLTELQKIILNAPEPRIGVTACAAALKTSTLIEKVRCLLNEGIDPSSIAVITFTRMAAQEMIERLGKDYKDGLFIGTIHALAAHFLSKKGLGGHINKIAEEENFDKLFDLCKNIDLTHAYEYVCVDEAQDCGEKELEFIFNKLEPPHYFCCFDFNQSIYGFRGARPDLLKKYLDKTNATLYSLNENFRNGADILNFAKGLLKKGHMADNSIPMRPTRGLVIKEKYSLKHLLNMIQSNGELKDWAILCRTNNECDWIMEDLEDNDIPCITFKQGDLNKKQLEEIMEVNKVKVLTAHSSKGLAWKYVVNYKLWNGKPEEIRLKYVAATRARDILIIYS
ncbi:MAG: UvrD-helicase domain-containing protein [Bacillota bacterium]|nr:UvrD-helicase domain-containing protein [Bacillota bacterium]